MPPDNAAYFQAAYVVTFVLYGAYYASLRWRRRALAARAAAIDAARSRGGGAPNGGAGA